MKTLFSFKYKRPSHGNSLLYFLFLKINGLIIKRFCTLRLTVLDIYLMKCLLYCRFCSVIPLLNYTAQSLEWGFAYIYLYSLKKKWPCHAKLFRFIYSKIYDLVMKNIRFSKVSFRWLMRKLLHAYFNLHV